MLIVSCNPLPGFDFYRCGWRLEERDGRMVRVGLCWPAGVTVLDDDALSAEQLDALRNDPGKRLSVRHVQEQAPAERVPHAQEQAAAETALGVAVSGPEPCPVPQEGTSTPLPTPSCAPAPECAATRLPPPRRHRAEVTRIERRDGAHLHSAGSAFQRRMKAQLRAVPRSGSGPPPKRAALAAPLP
jgi:hypothetical protein